MNNDISNSVEVRSVAKYLEYIKTLYGDESFLEYEGNKAFFFRGHVNADFLLLPSILRTQYEGQERRILLNYRDHLPRSVHHSRFDFVKDRIEILAEMQHYTIPTRLLDWTMSPLIALYFAVRAEDIRYIRPKEGSEKAYEAPNKKAKSCVWIYNPWTHQSDLRKKRKFMFDGWFSMMKLGRALLSDRKYSQIERDLQAVFHTPRCINIAEMEEPMGLIAPYQNNRMIHQASAFTIHGTKEEPLENIISSEYLKKVIIPNTARETILRELNLLFINEYTVFPDFVGMSNEIKDKGSLYYATNR